MSQNEVEINRKLGFDVPSDHLVSSKPKGKIELLKAFVAFLERSDRSRLFYPEFYTRATKDAAILTLNSKFIPKNASEVDEYFRCSIPNERYCLYRRKLRPYIGLAASTSGFDFSFLACQAYVESRFQGDAQSGAGAMGYSQIQPANIEYMNQVLRQSILKSGKRKPASEPSEKELRIRQIQDEIARIWSDFWKGTENAPKKICSDDLTCYRQAFLAQAISLKTDLLTIASSSSGIALHFDESGSFLLEKMDRGDSLLLLAASYNVGVTRMTRLISQFCKGSEKLKECLDRMRSGATSGSPEERARLKDVKSITSYIMRIRDCSQQYSAEQLDFNDDERWSSALRTEKMNAQRDQVAQCLLRPCAYFRGPAGLQADLTSEARSAPGLDSFQARDPIFHPGSADRPDPF